MKYDKYIEFIVMGGIIMFNLQAALDERLATLKKKKIKEKQFITSYNNSKESIEISLKQAGILNQNGKIIKRIAS